MSENSSKTSSPTPPINQAAHSPMTFSFRTIDTASAQSSCITKPLRTSRTNSTLLMASNVLLRWFFYIYFAMSQQIGQRPARPKISALLPGRLDISRNHILENYHYGKQAIPEQERRPFLQKMLRGCSVDVITTHDISQAFQLFDSQNDRGKPLDPTDLLKAYHLHELDVQGDDSASQDNQDISSQWMDSATISRIRELFNDHLFRIKRWSMKQSVLDGFSASNINMFKGLSLTEAERNDTPWTKPYRILEERYCSAENPLLKTAEDYPFQIDMSFASGKRFFDMTQHYLDLAENCGIFLQDSAENNDSFLETCDWFVDEAIKDSPNTPMEHIRAELCRIDLFREMLSLRNSNWHYKDNVQPVSRSHHVLHRPIRHRSSKRIR